MADQQLLKPIATQVRLLSSIAGLLLNQGPGKVRAGSGHWQRAALIKFH